MRNRNTSFLAALFAAIAFPLFSYAATAPSGTTTPAAAATPVAATPPASVLRLAIDDRLTSLSIVESPEGGMRLVRAIDFARAVGGDFRETRGPADAAPTMELRRAGGKWSPASGAGVRQGDDLLLPLGILCGQLGVTAEADVENGYIWIHTPGAKATRADFLEHNRAFFASRRLAAELDKRAVRCGLLAVNDRLLAESPTLLADGRSFLPLAETVAALGGTVQGESGKYPLTVHGDAGELLLPEETGAPHHGPFTIHASEPVLDFQGHTYVEDTLLRRAFHAEIAWSPEYSATRLVTAAQVEAPAVLFAGKALDQARAGATKQAGKMFRVAYLTFDDGPSRKVTPLVLETLRQNDIHATFFIIGASAKASPDLVVEEKREGHSIGNHTWTHDYKKLYASPEAFMEEIHRTNDLFRQILGEDTHLVRAPGGTVGHFKPGHYTAVHAEGFRCFQWNVDSGDSKSLSVKADEIVENVRKEAQGQSEIVVLMHDAETKAETARALPRIIELLRGMGYEFRPLTIDVEIHAKGIVQ
jgi:peptidoglycan/xylan/chitin deacetylase (PgdA/CDA1 family)